MKKVLLTFIITALVAGGGVYYWQQSQITNLNTQIDDLNTEMETMQSEIEAATEKDNLLSLGADSAECTDPKYQRPEIGGWTWPIHEAYVNHSDSLLGDLFTADACGASRLEEVAADLFPNGVTETGIYLNFTDDGPSAELEKELETIGFKWNEKYDWHLDKKIDYTTLLPLREWADEFSSNWGGLDE